MTAQILHDIGTIRRSVHLVIFEYRALYPREKADIRWTKDKIRSVKIKQE